MIRYHGRQMPCFTWRQRGGTCRNYAEYRAESGNAFVHVCANCATRFTNDPEWTLVPLAPEGELDTLDAVSVDNDALLLSPWMVSIDGRTRDEVLRERHAREP